MDRRDFYEQQLINAATELGTIRERQRTLATRMSQLERQIQQYTHLLRTTTEHRRDKRTEAEHHRATQLPLMPNAAMPDRILHFLTEKPDAFFSTQDIP